MNEAVIELIEDKNVPLARTTKWRLRKRGLLPYLQIGRRVYYKREHLEEMTRNCEHREATPMAKAA
jgi:hypothetical protein